jgi:hypothetical protein
MKIHRITLVIRGCCTILFLVTTLISQTQVTTGNGLAGDVSGVIASPVFTPDTAWEPITSIYFELGGKIMYSLNVDFRKRENFAWSLGMSVLADETGDPLTYYQTMFFPSVMAYYLTGRKHRVELGGGGCPLIGTEQGLAALAIFGSAGYRYQKKSGLIFRINFSPFIGIPIDENARSTLMPWGGISLGYSF